ncbi:MAG: tetratricopeptide repeat protein, partial [Actinomycetota bacterium]|nr:tetratricopeptide repeat protein [Actinomycetota bacterium]
MDFRILGPLDVYREDGRVRLGGRRQRAVLALLLLNANRRVSTDELIDALWPESPPPTASTAVQVVVSRLRKLLEPSDGDGRPQVLLTQPGGYLLRVERDELDVYRWERLVSAGREALAQDRFGLAARLLREALGLWRGTPLADLRYESFARNEIDRLEELRLTALEDRIEADLSLGREVELVGELEGLIREHPLRERFRQQLMVALYRCGRQAEALAAYRDARRTLVETLGIEPGTELQELERGILNQDPRLASPRAQAKASHPLPVPATPLVGRDAELDTVVRTLRRPDVRLVTLTGPPGTGKTRLALEAAVALADEFERVAFVALASVADPALVASEIAQALGLHEAGGEALVETLADSLRDRRVLLVLDNFEQVLPAADAVARLLASAPRLNVLVTSREALRLSGEREYLVPPLELPDLVRLPDHRSLARFDAVRLFVERVQAVKSGFELTEENAAAVAELCVRLDGLPLAIELAAARGRTLTPQALVPRLGRGLKLLTGGARDLPARQRTMHAAVEWSHALLDPSEQRLFARLSVFAGGCTLDAAEAVCEGAEERSGDVLDGVASLVEKSLLGWSERGGEPRFEMLETIREYARERLAESGEAEALALKHADYFLRLAERADPELGRGREQATWHDRMEAEHDNFRAALAFLRDRACVAAVLRLAGALSHFWLVRGHLSEGRNWLESALAAAPEDRSAVRARALLGAGPLAAMQGDVESARRFLEESLALYRELGDESRIAAAVGDLGLVTVIQGDTAEGMRLHEEALALARALGDRPGIAGQLVNLSHLTLIAGDHDRAVLLGGEALALFRELGDEEGVATALGNLSLASLARGRPEEAVDSLAETLRLSLRLGYRDRIAGGLVGVGAVLASRDDWEEAARLLAAVEANLETAGGSLD